MSYRSGSSSDDYSSSSSDEDANEMTTRKFELSHMIGTHFPGLCGGQTTLSNQWSFILDDGLFERRANFSTTADLWRHLERIDSTMTKIRRKCKKGTVRLFKPEYEDLARAKNHWDAECSPKEGGKWVFRFNRKFPLDLSNFWVDLILTTVAETLPRSDLIVGCVYTTRKGKSEMEVWCVGGPFSGGICASVEKEQQLAIRALLGVGDKDRTISIAYKSHASERQRKQDYERVMQVKQKKDKHSTWPLARRGSEEENMESKLADYRAQIDEDPYQDFGREHKPRVYHYEDEDEDSWPASPSKVTPPTPSKVPASALLVASPVQPPLQEQHKPAPPALPLEELQQLQLQDLRLQPPSDSDSEYGRSPPKLDLSLLRTRLDSADPSPANAFEDAGLRTHKGFHFEEAGRKMHTGFEASKKPSLACLRTRLDSGDAAPSASSLLSFAECKKAEGAVKQSPVKAAERAVILEEQEESSEEGDDEAETWDRDPLAFLDRKTKRRRSLDSGKAKPFGSSPPSMQFGTNPPDFSSPLMMAALRVEKRRAKYQTL